MMIELQENPGDFFWCSNLPQWATAYDKYSRSWIDRTVVVYKNEEVQWGRQKFLIELLCANTSEFWRSDLSLQRKDYM